MPERWLTELRKLDALEPSADVFDQAKEGPRPRSSMPSARGRLGVALVALVVAIAGGSGAFFAFRDRGPEPLASFPGFHALWPEQELTVAQDAQAKADAGDPKFAWRRIA